MLQSWGGLCRSHVRSICCWAPTTLPLKTFWPDSPADCASLPPNRRVLWKFCQLVSGLTRQAGWKQKSQSKLWFSCPRWQLFFMTFTLSLLLGGWYCELLSFSQVFVSLSVPAVKVRVVGPRDLQVSELGHSSLRLTWSHATSDVRGYRLLVTPLSSQGHLQHLQQRQVRARTQAHWHWWDVI